MPNYCMNALRLTFESHWEAHKFLRGPLHPGHSGGLLEFFYPQPDYTKIRVPSDEYHFQCVHNKHDHRDRRGGYHLRPKVNREEDWYDWRCEHWGTKWDVEDLQVALATPKVPWEVPFIVMHFRTAWSPPIGAIMHFAMKPENKHIEFDLVYSDPMMNFMGHWNPDLIEENISCDINRDVLSIPRLSLIGDYLPDIFDGDSDDDDNYELLE